MRFSEFFHVVPPSRLHCAPAIGASSGLWSLSRSRPLLHRPPYLRPFPGGGRHHADRWRVRLRRFQNSSRNCRRAVRVSAWGLRCLPAVRAWDRLLYCPHLRCRDGDVTVKTPPPVPEPVLQRNPFPRRYSSSPPYLQGCICFRRSCRSSRRRCSSSQPYCRCCLWLRQYLLSSREGAVRHSHTAVVAYGSGSTSGVPEKVQSVTVIRQS